MKRIISYVLWSFAFSLCLAGMTGCVNPSAAVLSDTKSTITSFVANPTAVTAGGTASLMGVFTNGTGMIMPGNLAATSGTPVHVSPSVTTTYTLTVTPASGTAITQTATVTVAPAAPTISSFVANPTSITVGGTAALTGIFANCKGVITPGNLAATSGTPVSVSPSITTTYTLTVTPASGTAITQTATVMVTPAAPAISSFVANPISIMAGGSTSLTGVFVNGMGVITPGNLPATNGMPVSVSPSVTTTYTLTVTPASGTAIARTTIVTVTPAVPTISSFTANPTAVAPGGTASLTGVFANGTGMITPDNSPATSGIPVSVSPSITTIYTLTVTPVIGVAITETATVTVGQAAPTISSFTANPTSVSAGSSSTLSWATGGATSIAITPGTFTSASASGSTSVSPAATTTYTLTATNAAGSTTSTAKVTVSVPSKPTISSFTANPTSIPSGSSSTLNWATGGATSITITPGTFTSALASGSTSVSPTATTTYTLTAINASGSTTSTAKVTVATAGGPLAITTTSCPGGTQGAAYSGCTITASGGSPPYTYSLSTDVIDFPSLPEGMSLDANTGKISSSLIGGQGTYTPEFVVTDSVGAQANADISFAINGSNAFLANIFPSTSIFHHRVDAATTGLPVDTSPAAPVFSSYLQETIKPFFGNNSGAPFPNGIPAIEVPNNQADVSVSFTNPNPGQHYQSYFTSGPIPAYAPVEGTSNSTGDRHVLVYLEAGGGNNPALYEMWQGIYEDGPWTDSSNALWPDVSSNALTEQGNGTSDAAGLPVAPLLANADEVIGTGTPSSPNGTIQHPIRFTLNHMLNYWVWPATETSGVGHCTATDGSSIPTESEISQSSPPASCTMSGAAGEIYRLKAAVATPSCASTSPQAAILITGFRDYGIILADNGDSGGLIGTPDARWNDDDLACLTDLILSDFEPVNVSSLMVSNDSGTTSH